MKESEIKNGKKEEKVIGSIATVAYFHKIPVTIAFFIDIWLFSCFSLFFLSDLLQSTIKKVLSTMIYLTLLKAKFNIKI